MRRHPDIRRLRRDADIDALFDTQFGLLKSLWQTLAPGGRLIYVTCSVLRRENEQVIAAFLADQSDAVETPIEAAEDAGKEANWGLNCEHGRQILPGQHDSDGFYYAILARQ
jgi:16S rRNA (cytosine967-C5)-methyltransferase